MWTVVVFIEENSVEVVPESWLSNDHFCFWPKGKDAEKVGHKIASCEEPDENWQIFRIRFPGGKMRTFDNIINARRASKMAEDNSSFSEASDFEGKRRKRKRILYSDEEEEKPRKNLTLAMPSYKKMNNTYYINSEPRSRAHSSSCLDNDSTSSRETVASQKEPHSRATSSQAPYSSSLDNDSTSSRETFGSQKEPSRAPYSSCLDNDSTLSRETFGSQKEPYSQVTPRATNSSCLDNESVSLRETFGSRRETPGRAHSSSFLDNDRFSRKTFGSQKDETSLMEKTLKKSLTPNTNNDLIHSVFRELSKLNVKMDSLQQDVSALLQRGGKNVPTDDSFFKDILPIKDDPIELEETLDDEENYKKFVNFITLIGGQHKGDAVSRTLSRILTNDAASKYSWKGKKGKRSFHSLKISNAVIEGIMLNTKIVATQKDIELEIMSWLRHAPERLKRTK